MACRASWWAAMPSISMASSARHPIRVARVAAKAQAGGRATERPARPGKPARRPVIGLALAGRTSSMPMPPQTCSPGRKAVFRRTAASASRSSTVTCRFRGQVSQPRGADEEDIRVVVIEPCDQRFEHAGRCGGVFGGVGSQCPFRARPAPCRELPKSLTGNVVPSSEAAGTRTQDQRIKSPMLYRLSYSLGNNPTEGWIAGNMPFAAAIHAALSRLFPCRSGSHRDPARPSSRADFPTETARHHQAASPGARSPPASPARWS